LSRGLEKTVFDYQDIPEEKRGEVHELVGRIRKNKTQMFVAAVAMGVDLLKLRDAVPHGCFGPLLKRGFQWTQKTAENYMKLARHFAAIIEPFSDLNLTTAKALVATSTQAEIRDELFARAEAGEKISNVEVKGRIAAGKSQKEPAALVKEPEPKNDIPEEESWEGSRSSQDSEPIGDRATTNDNAPAATGEAATEEVLGALLELAHCIWKNRDRPGPRDGQVNMPHCDPYDVAKRLMDAEHRAAPE
jgi:hypothetical protein